MIDIRKDKDSGYYYGGIHYDNMEEVLATGVLDFCGCGMPTEALRYVTDSLRLLQCRQDISPEVWEKEREALFATYGAEYLMWYFLDEKELTEHGFCVPGWLTDKGEEFLRLADDVLGAAEEV